MKYTFKTKDPQEALRYIKADAMAAFIWELVHNGWRKFKHTDYDYQEAWERIHELLEQYNINIDDLQ